MLNTTDEAAKNREICILSEILDKMETVALTDKKRMITIG